MRAPKNMLVTGGCGFIGSAFVRFLLRAQGSVARVVNLDLLTYAANPDNVAEYATDPRYVLVQGDIGDQALVARLCEEHAIDTIVHFAAESHVDRSILGPLVFVETNVVGTVKLLEVVRARPGLHFHHVSTDEVYGSLGPEGLFTETTRYQPNSPYAASKAASDHLVRAYAHTYGLSVTLSNCSNNYGPYQFPEKLVPLMILNMLEQKPLPVYGDGLNVRDWLHVDDHAEAIWAIVTRGARGETYNVGGRSERTNLDLLRMLIDEVARQTGTSADGLGALMRFVADRPGHDRRYAIDCDRIERELGFTPRHDLAGGIAATVRWYLENGGWIERVRSGAYRQWIEANYGDRDARAATPTPG
ncbi:dTDP-glucose 4,6-dehydratase [Chondromyces crocatus]|uniref:dTDP-glucose 4,6-dehydratase n=1 Tax=Chondromyces crocatus TaxID=52 RepID=A0A0K1E8Y0_CHOCO|nr:dTDP-glucose 4,6-dehydratase [Chondromyces crocatus]AKT37122.1 dTDP-glucose 4,6-dehydratase [Chondromyces crocatus]